MADNTNLAYISQITLPSGTTYQIKDAEAREDLELLTQELTGALVFVGVTTTKLVDGSTTAIVSINGIDHKAETGDVVISGKKEFVFTSTGNWVELGDFSDLQSMLGELAYLDSAEGSYTPAGNITLAAENYTVTSTGEAAISGEISQPVFSGEENQAINVAGTALIVDEITASFAGTKSNVSVTGSVIASGTVSKPTFRGTTATINASGTYTPEGNITAAPLIQEVQVTSTGSINQITSVSSEFEGTEDDISVSGSCVPSGIINTPDINVTVATANNTSWTGTVSDETLVFSAATITYATGVSAALASAPVFTGKPTTVDVSGKFTPAGIITNTYGGAAATISVTGTVEKVTDVSATFSGKESTVDVAAIYQPAGEVTQPTFEGLPTAVEAGGTFTPAGTVTPTFTTKNQDITASGTFTAKGAVSTPTFSGTKAVLSVTGTVPTAKSASFVGTAATITVSKPASA